MPEKRASTILVIGPGTREFAAHGKSVTSETCEHEFDALTQ